ncbi:glycerophosphodiester phosphodiesterase [Halorussus lipolyticus]|uniref:glycerophosphodiester phosphodiesterase n=1 Tax=Halorussus lipolyticus TaxID=3034024 RepID=UPI0023E80CAD|nr:glycerophosphodiester phosphodiesterase family protein [Halorussus sp. DT80]
MRLVAHRGFADRYPENTVRAFEDAATVADWIELDVRRCESGELVVFHDDRLDRLTGASGRVAETPWETLRTLDVLDSGEEVPVLGDALAAIPASVGVNVELKERGLSADALAIAEEVGNDVVVSSFDAETLREVREADSSVSLAFITREATGAVETARELGCEFLHPHFEACLDAEDDAGTGLVAQAHDAGLEVNAWTVKTPEEADALRAVGVDGLIADSPDVR